MYQYLTGKLVEKLGAGIVLEVGGVGYFLSVPLSTYAALPEPGAQVRILTHFVVREDAHTLYGFLTEEERQMFRLLISVSGIGPKMGLTVLSGISLPDLRRAIIEGSLPVLTHISGIGRKTAERVIVELREKIVLEERRTPLAAKAKNAGEESVIEDSLRALIELGYRKQNATEAIEKALQQSQSEKLSVSDLIRTSLKYV